MRVVQQNQTGQMGAFETVLTIPNLTAANAQAPHVLAMSPVLVGSQFSPVKDSATDPLAVDGKQLVMSVTHVFDTTQTLYLYFEVYDPQPLPKSHDAIKLLTNVGFYHGRVKVFESQLVATGQITDPARNAAVVQLAIPLSQIKPGYYLCQVNAVDDAAARFAFPRIPVLIRPPAAAAATQPQHQ